jgi:hypothetical protein
VHYYGEHWKIGDFGCIIMMTILVKFDDFFWFKAFQYILFFK